MANSYSEPTLIVEDETLKHGFVIIPKNLLFARNLSHSAKILYALLLSYAWQDNFCFPGYERLCADMAVSENVVRRFMSELQQAGIVKQKRRGLGKTNVYTIADLRTANLEAPQPQDMRSRTSESEVLKPQDLRSTIETVEVEEEDKDPGNKERAKSNTRMSDQRKKTNYYDADRAKILPFIEDFAGEFRDQAPLTSSVTRAQNIFKKAGCSLDEFRQAMYEARRITKEKTSNIRSEIPAKDSPWPQKTKMAYFFAVLEDLLGQKVEQ